MGWRRKEERSEPMEVEGEIKRKSEVVPFADAHLKPRKKFFFPLFLGSPKKRTFISISFINRNLRDRNFSALASAEKSQRQQQRQSSAPSVTRPVEPPENQVPGFEWISSDPAVLARPSPSPGCMEAVAAEGAIDCHVAQSSMTG